MSMMSGWHAVLAGALLGLSLAAPPGPVMAIMVSASLQGRVRQAFLTALGAISADFCWLTLAVLGALTVLGAHPRWLGALGLLGAALLLWMAWGAWASARRGIAESHAPGSWKLGFLTVLTSPFSLAWWLANGSVLYLSWGLPGIAGLFAALLLYSALFCKGFFWLRTRAARLALAMAYLSAVVLAGFGAYLAYRACGLLWG